MKHYHPNNLPSLYIRIYLNTISIFELITVFCLTFNSICVNYSTYDFEYKWLYLEDFGRSYISQDAYGMALIMRRTRNGRKKTSPAVYSSVKRASSPNQKYCVIRPVPIRKSPQLANVVPHAKVRNFFLLPFARFAAAVNYPRQSHKYFSRSPECIPPRN